MRILSPGKSDEAPSTSTAHAGNWSGLGAAPPEDAFLGRLAEAECNDQATLPPSPRTKAHRTGSQSLGAPLHPQPGPCELSRSLDPTTDPLRPLVPPPSQPPPTCRAQLRNNLVSSFRRSSASELAFEPTSTRSSWNAAPPLVETPVALASGADARTADVVGAGVEGMRRADVGGEGGSDQDAPASRPSSLSEEMPQLPTRESFTAGFASLRESLEGRPY